jgi:outer membrane protein
MTETAVFSTKSRRTAKGAFVNSFWKQALCVLIISLPAVHADLMRLSGGAGIWHADPSGSLRYENAGNWVSAEDQLGYDSSNMPYLWLNLKHPVPIWPNLRLEYTEVFFDGRTDGTVAWGSKWSYSDNAWSELELNELDMLFYYNLLDNTFWLTFELGLDVKYVDARYLIRDDYGMGAAYEEQDAFFLPQGYLRTRAEIPMSDLALEADLKYIGYGNSKVYDARLKADYTFGSFTFGRPAVEVGYRMQRIKVDEKDYNTKIDIDAAGFYVGGMLRF